MHENQISYTPTQVFSLSCLVTLSEDCWHVQTVLDYHVSDPQISISATFRKGEITELQSLSVHED